MSRLADLGGQLQRGERSIDFVGRRRLWLLISCVVIVVSALGLGFRQLDLGVEFDGGSVFEVSSATTSVGEVRDIVEGAGAEEPKVHKLGSDRYRIETTAVSTEEAQPIMDALSKELNVPPAEITTNVVGPSWGDDVTNKALTSLLIFLALVAVYLAIMFEFKMAIGALLALLHDLIITVGIYAIVGFVVTPATVIGLLTILGYSLYDTVVVFDKVRENTADLKKTNRYTFSQAANLAVNQTLVRSINTTVIALLPVSGLLFVGAGLLGAGTLKDLSLVLFIGMAVGAYSSICLATPIVAFLKEREPEMQELAKRVAVREAAQRKKAPAGKRSGGANGAPVTADEDDRTPEPVARAAATQGSTAPRPPGARVQPKRGGPRGARNSRPKKK
ncbi:protein translocase subunit SecF [Sporichthya polymorpha]|uniref:protein translocase subunit SecF n=1 Tax=Sporichthya polymorpha TaxID=35751 RepID=UPI0003768A15|nr:protein translocase subunit SecF [Sporichthya polymorpha]